MLSFDIETEGLYKHKDRITVAAVYDPEKGIERCYNFIKGTDNEIELEIRGFLEQLDNADTLCSFNGARCLFNKDAWSIAGVRAVPFSCEITCHHEQEGLTKACLSW